MRGVITAVAPTAGVCTVELKDDREPNSEITIAYVQPSAIQLLAGQYGLPVSAKHSVSVT